MRPEIVETGRRRRWSNEQKLKIVVESMSAPRLASATARHYGIWRSQLSMWRRAFRTARVRSQAGPAFVPAVFAPASQLLRPEGMAVSRMEIVLPCGRRIVVDADVDAQALARVIAVLDRS